MGSGNENVLKVITMLMMMKQISYPNSEGCPDWADYPIYVFEEPISESDSYSCRALHSLCLRDEPAHSKCDEFLEGYEKEFGEN